MSTSNSWRPTVRLFQNFLYLVYIVSLCKDKAVAIFDLILARDKRHAQFGRLFAPPAVTDDFLHAL